MAEAKKRKGTALLAVMNEEGRERQGGRSYQRKRWPDVEVGRARTTIISYKGEKEIGTNAEPCIQIPGGSAHRSWASAW